MLKFAAGIAALALAAGAAHADTPTDFVKRHTSSGGNVDAIMADYADDAVVLQNGRAVQGKAEIRKLFEGMFGGRRGGAGGPPPGGAPAGGAPAGGGMNVTKVWEEGNVGFVTWEMGPVHATEEFIIRNGKIAVQAIFMAGGGTAPGAPRPPQ
ncbi:MAG: nuclear transport factor 2 family protein [Sphingobium sp.]|nr:nuclear transport factor 2 family protein [Sphingobium sp.]